MVARLPTDADLGGIPSPDSSRPIASIDTTGYARGAAAIGEGTKQLGEGIAKAGTSLGLVAAKQQEESYLTAHANLLTKKVELDTQFLDDTGYEDRVQRYTDRFNKIVSETGGDVGGPFRQKFDATAKLLAAQAVQAQTIQAQTQGSDAALTHLQQEGEWLINNSVGTMETQTRTAAIDGFNSRVDSLVARKVLTQAKALTAKQAWTRQFALSDALARIDRGDFSVLDEIRGARGDVQQPSTIYDVLRPDQREQLLLRVERAKGAQLIDQQRQDAIARREALARSETAETDYLKRLNPLPGDDMKPVTAAEIVRDNSLTREAQERLTRLVQQSTKSHDLSTYGSGFYDLFRRVHAADGDPAKITDPGQLYPHVVNDGDLTTAGMDKLRQEIFGKRTPEGAAEAEMKKQFFAMAKGQITGSGEILRDTKGDEQFLRFMTHAYQSIDDARKAGKSVTGLYDPSSPEYLGKQIGAFKRTTQQIYADMMAENGTTAAPVKNKPFDINSIKTVDEAVRLYLSGKITKAQADQLATDRGWAGRRPPLIMPNVPMSFN